jgi:hypothetical protein
VLKRQTYAVLYFTTTGLLLNANEATAALESAKASAKAAIKGVITIENIPAEGIKLALRGPDKSAREAVTDRDGSYQWTGIDRGTYWLSFKLPGSTRLQEMKVDIPSNETLSLNLAMHSNPSGDPKLTLILEAP